MVIISGVPIFRIFTVHVITVVRLISNRDCLNKYSNNMTVRHNKSQNTENSGSTNSQNITVTVYTDGKLTVHEIILYYHSCFIFQL